MPIDNCGDEYQNKFSTLAEMLNSDEYQAFMADRLSNQLFIDDPERAARIYEYAENGSDGSKYCEVIDDWRDFVSSLNRYDPELDDEWFDHDIDEQTADNILKEINKCEQWHIDNGSYEQIIG